jgi:hypothetical protein
MKILLASFRFGSSQAETSFVVAYVYCESDRVSVEPVHSALEGTPIILRLRELAEAFGGEAYAKLTQYRSPEWSFDDAAIH